MAQSFHDKTDEELVDLGSRELGTGSTLYLHAPPAQLEMLRRLKAAIQENTATLAASSRASIRLGYFMIVLTIAILILTGVMAVRPLVNAL